MQKECFQSNLLTLIFIFLAPLLTGRAFNAFGIEKREQIDLSYCDDSELNDLSGWVAQDFVVWHSLANPFPIPDRSHHLVGIVKMLTKLSPELGNDLTQFVLQIEKKGDQFLWKDDTLMEPVFVSNIPFQVIRYPENCRKQGENRVARLFTSKLTKKGTSIQYSQKTLGLFEKSSLQYSLLLIGLWLRQHTASNRVKTDLNLFIHSEFLQTLDGAAFSRAIQKLGFEFKRRYKADREIVFLRNDILFQDHLTEHASYKMRFVTEESGCIWIVVHRISQVQRSVALCHYETLELSLLPEDEVTCITTWNIYDCSNPLSVTSETGIFSYRYHSAYIQPGECFQFYKNYMPRKNNIRVLMIEPQFPSSLLSIKIHNKNWIADKPIILTPKILSNSEEPESLCLHNGADEMQYVEIHYANKLQ